MAGNGYRLTDVTNGVRFDLDGDGTLDRVAWTHQDSDDAFLALDRNGNGRIDNGSELFGNNTPAYADLPVKAKTGFEALKLLEAPAYGLSRADLIIDERDAVFARLLLWTDRNHNGISEPDELEGAAAAGLVSIETDYAERKRRDQHGNEFRQTSASWWLDETGNRKRRAVWDVWLQVGRQ
jgi:hypothetical protein